MISQSYIDGLTRQVFIKDYILNGLFPGQSDIIKSIRSKKRNWEFNDRFEYRMLLATSGTGGALNSQIFNPNVSLRNPNNLTYGVFKATYGTVSDGFDVDMTVNLETDNSRGAFINEYATLVHSMRVNTASLFKNFAINGRYGVVHRISANNVTTVAATTGYTANGPQLGRPFTIAVPINVYASGFKTGRYLIKTSGTESGQAASTMPWGHANVAELYMVVDNQPRSLTLVSIGTTGTPWQENQFLEVFGNRSFQSHNSVFWGPAPAGWSGAGLILAPDNPFNQAAYAVRIAQWLGTGVYTSGTDAGTGAMEGLSDLFPWHLSDNTVNGTRLGLDLPFRNQPNRRFFSTEQAGGFYVRQNGESIIDAIMNGVALVTATVPYADVGVWMNPDTMLAMGEQETENVNWVKQITSAAPHIFQRGITSHDYQIGSKTIPATLQDHNLPTNIVIIGPRDDLSYNCWAQDMYKIDDFIQETWSSVEPPKPEDIKIPADFSTKLDFSRRITYGAPVLGDHRITTEFQGGNFIHPSNRLPVAFHEMGALFTEVPYAYAVVNLRGELIKPSDVHTDSIWAN